LDERGDLPCHLQPAGRAVLIPLLSPVVRTNERPGKPCFSTWRRCRTPQRLSRTSDAGFARRPRRKAELVHVPGSLCPRQNPAVSTWRGRGRPPDRSAGKVTRHTWSLEQASALEAGRSGRADRRCDCTLVWILWEMMTGERRRRAHTMLSHPYALGRYDESARTGPYGRPRRVAFWVLRDLGVARADAHR